MLWIIITGGKRSLQVEHPGFSWAPSLRVVSLDLTGPLSRHTLGSTCERPVQGKHGIHPPSSTTAWPEVVWHKVLLHWCLCVFRGPAPARVRYALYVAHPTVLLLVTILYNTLRLWKTPQEAPKENLITEYTNDFLCVYTTHSLFMATRHFLSLPLVVSLFTVYST